MLDSQMNKVAASMGTDTHRLTTVTFVHVLYTDNATHSLMTFSGPLENAGECTMFEV